MDIMGITITEEMLQTWLLTYGLGIVGALLILLIGWIAAKFVRKISQNLMTRTGMDPILINFLANIIYALTLAFVMIAALNKLGVQTASLIAIMGAAGLAIGLALQGSLSNFASGVMIIMLKHFKLGDFIQSGSVSGTVIDMNIFTTTLHTLTNEKIIVPNAMLTSDALTNFTANDVRRIDHLLGVSYDDDLTKVRAAIGKVIAAEERVLPDPAPFVGMDSLGDSSVNYTVRVWVKRENFLATKCELLEAFKREFDSQDISIPFPQRDVHLFNPQALPAPEEKPKKPASKTKPAKKKAA